LRRVEAGNQSFGFTEKRPKIVIILDNASFPKNKECLDKNEIEMPNLHL
jgi:hypothetical protein